MLKEGNKKSGFLPYYFALAGLLVLVALTYTNRVDDLDLWWHLKTGEQILKKLSLPQIDPFAYTTDATIPLPEQDLQALSSFKKPSDFPYWGVNRTQSWLGQVLFYLAYAAGGFYGIGLLKVMLFVLTFLVTFCSMRQKGAGPMAALLILSLTAVIGQDFAYSRPQIFTFLCLSILFYLFAEFKNGGRKFMALPLLFLVWSNIHGGFVIGAVLLLAFWGAETGKYLLHEKYNILDRFASPAGDIKRISFIALLSLIAMVLNPNHYKTFLLPLAGNKSVFSSIEEYAQPMLYEYHAYWFMLALVILLLILFFRYNDPTDVLFVAILASGSQMGIRGIILFAIGVSPFLAASLSQLWQWLLRRRPVEKLFSRPGIQRIASYRPQLILLLVLMLLFGGRQAKGEGFMKFSISADSYPGNAVAFLRAGNFPGRLFNPYNWGGYLIWQYPERQVFIDGRGQDEQAYFQYQLIIGVQGGLPSSPQSSRPPLWKRLLDDYDIQVVLTYAVSTDGVLVPLVDMLAVDSEWALVYQDGTALIFLRDSQENRNRFGRYYLNKRERIYDEIVSESRRGLRETPATSGYYWLLGSIYLQRRELGSARESFEKYLQIKPNDVRVIQYLNMIRQLNGETPLPIPQKPISPHNW